MLEQGGDAGWQRREGIQGSKVAGVGGGYMVEEGHVVENGGELRLLEEQPQ